MMSDTLVKFRKLTQVFDPIYRPYEDAGDGPGESYVPEAHEDYRKNLVRTLELNDRVKLLVAGQPGCGKTTLLLSVAHHLRRQGRCGERLVPSRKLWLRNKFFGAMLLPRSRRVHMSRMSTREIEDGFAALGLGQESERQRIKALATLGEDGFTNRILVTGLDDNSSGGREGDADADVA